MITACVWNTTNRRVVRWATCQPGVVRVALVTTDTWSFGILAHQQPENGHTAQQRSEPWWLASLGGRIPSPKHSAYPKSRHPKRKAFGEATTIYFLPDLLPRVGCAVSRNAMLETTNGSLWRVADSLGILSAHVGYRAHPISKCDTNSPSTTNLESWDWHTDGIPSSRWPN